MAATHLADDGHQGRAGRVAGLFACEDVAGIDADLPKLVP
jgi:hypothetical protein